MVTKMRTRRNHKSLDVSRQGSWDARFEYHGALKGTGTKSREQTKRGSCRGDPEHRQEEWAQSQV